MLAADERISQFIRPSFFDSNEGRALIAASGLGGLGLGSATAFGTILSAKASRDSAKAIQQQANQTTVVTLQNGTVIGSSGGPRKRDLNSVTRIEQTHGLHKRGLWTKNSRNTLKRRPTTAQIVGLNPPGHDAELADWLQKEETSKQDSEIKKSKLTRVRGQRWKPEEISGHRFQKRGRWFSSRRVSKQRAAAVQNVRLNPPGHDAELADWLQKEETSKQGSEIKKPKLVRVKGQRFRTDEPHDPAYRNEASSSRRA